LDPARFSSASFRRTPHPILAQIDPPRHTVMRKVIARAFTPTRVAALEPAIREFAGSLVDALRKRGAVDLAHDYAAVVPSTVMGRLLGVPQASIQRFREISDLHMRRISNADALVPMRMSDEQIRLGRASSQTVAFGWGIHFCPGAVLARREARVAIEELLRRAPGLTAAGSPERVRSSWALGYEHLPARLA
jgi:cytochrome P450